MRTAVNWGVVLQRAIISTAPLACFARPFRMGGVNDILIAVVGGPRGFPEAANAVFPQTQMQTCRVRDDL